MHRPPQKPQQLLTRDPGEGQAGRTQNRRLQRHTALPTQREPEAAMAMGTKQDTRKAKEFKDLAATHSVGPGSRAGSRSFADKNLPPLTSQQLSAFQDVFELFSSSRTGTVGMQSLRAALGTAGIRLSPLEMREALHQADLDGDGTVGFEDFLGVFTNSHRLPQYLGQVRDSRVWDSQGLQTLFLETLFKLTRQGFVPYNYYSKKQRALPLAPGCRGRSQGQGCTEHSHCGPNFYCQAARISGLSHAQLASLLHGLRKAGSCSPYSQIPKLAPSSEVLFPKSYTSRHPWPRTNQRQQRNPAPAGSSDQPVEDTRRWKLAPSPPTLVQKQPHSPSPACLQISAMKNLYK